MSSQPRPPLESRNYLNIDSLFLEATGLSYIEFAAATYSFYMHFALPKSDEHGRRVLSAFLNVEEFTAQVERPEALHTWFGLASVPEASARDLLAQTKDSTSIAILRPLMSTPLVSVDKIAYCPALRYLPNVAGNGLIFRLGDYLRESRGNRQSDQLRRFYADFLEAYTAKLLGVATGI